MGAGLRLVGGFKYREFAELSYLQFLSNRYGGMRAASVRMNKGAELT